MHSPAEERFYSQSYDMSPIANPPDDSGLDEDAWAAKIDAVLADCAKWQAVTDGVLAETEEEDSDVRPWVHVPAQLVVWRHPWLCCETPRPEQVCRCGMYRLVWE